MKKNMFITVVFTFLAMFTLAVTSEASSTKVMWGKTELVKGQIGKVTLYADMATYKADGTRGKVLPAGGEYRVYTFRTDLYGGEYGLGDGLFVHMYGALNYETPSKSKLALLEDYSPKVMWGKTELKKGQIGKVTILEETVLFKVTYGDGVQPGLEPIRQLMPNEEYRVYSAKHSLDGYYVPMYGLGGGYYIVQNDTNLNGVTVKYETPSKSKLALLN